MSSSSVYKSLENAGATVELPPGKKEGRKPLQLDSDSVQALASILCTDTEIATLLRCSVDTLVNRFSENLTHGRANAHASIRRTLFHKGVNEGDVKALHILAKNYLGFRDKVDVTGSIAVINGTNEKIQQQAQYIDAILQELKNIQEPAQLPKGLISE